MLSIVVIGKNEAASLPRLHESIVRLKEYLDFPVQTIFVDSASSDASLDFARTAFDTVVELGSSPHLCASAGRYAGTFEAHYPWIFYIDGDMDLCPDFFPYIAAIDDLEPEFVGLIGQYIHRFDNYTEAMQSFARSYSQRDHAGQFGGAVILRREAVMAAGNWDPAIYGREEFELYVRLGNGRPVVKYVPVPMIYHYSEYYSRLQLVMRLLFPSAGLGKVFFGYGQVVRALAIRGKLGVLIRLDYQAWIFWAALVVLGFVAVFISLPWAFVAMLGLFLGFSIWLRPGLLMRYLTLPISIVPGWFKYFPWYRPALRNWGSIDESAA